MQSVQSQPKEREFDFDDLHFRFIAGLAHAKTGIVLAANKKDMVYGRLARRLRTLGMDNFADYCALLQEEGSADEMGQMVNAITTNLTSFFRESHHFDHLRDEVLPSLQGKRLRIWSSACSSGMEPYSIAMTVKGTLRDLPQWDARILATDIDTNMVNTAANGEYAASDLDKVPAAYRQYVERGAKPGSVCMSAGLKELIAFKQLNLLEGWPMKGPFDAIFCRNVVIYFDKETKEKLFDRMADMLKPGGFLYIGHSENLHGLTDRFELVGRTIYRRIK